MKTIADVVKRICFRRPRICPKRFQEKLFENLDKSHLGRGLDIHTPEVPTDWPSAYALISSACVDQVESPIGEGPSRSVSCCWWLLENVGCNSTGAPLWGVPYPRKIWMDEKPVAGGTAFCIPTSHAIQALCEISCKNSVDEDLKDQSRNAAIAAVSYYANNCFDTTEEGVIFWYSPLEQHSFHITNATAMIAGQIQRVCNSEFDKNLANQADLAIKHLLSIRLGIGETFAWNYFGDKIPPNKKNRTNDLLHEAFICNGLLDYKEFGGRGGGEYEYIDLYNCLKRFYRNDSIYEYSAIEPIESRKKHPARVWAVGHALYVVSRIEKLLGNPKKMQFSTVLYKELSENYFDGSDLFYRPGGEIVTSRVREVGHVLLGLSAYINSRKKKPKPSLENHRAQL